MTKEQILNCLERDYKKMSMSLEKLNMNQKEAGFSPLENRDYYPFMYGYIKEGIRTILAEEKRLKV